MTFLTFEKLFNLIESVNLNIPKYVYHATYYPLIKSIKKHGLGKWNHKNWDDSQNGIVYLAYDHYQAESYAESSESIPEDWLDQIVVLQITTDLLDKQRFRIDSNNLDGSTLEYHGIIPPECIQISNFIP